MSKYKATIGMEIHVELKTNSKMFCACPNDLGQNKKPNENICPVCSGQPGTLPVPNKKAIEFVQLAGLALNCHLRSRSKFDRKNYFYPDLPKGYQISQYDQPLCEKGKIMINDKEIGITRIHMEEDTGKLTHPKGQDYSLVDLNRAGTPLMELVTEPDFETGEEAKLFSQKLQQICRYLGISDADMEKGNMRCEANVSVYKEGKDRLSGTKVEVKNINSFKFVEKAINYEIERQTELLEQGKEVIQETRGWDANRNATLSQRVKETAADYRYFPEPDIPPLEFNEEHFKKIKAMLPELPEEKLNRFQKEYSVVSYDNLELLILDKKLADYFEEVVSELADKIKAEETSASLNKLIKLTANYINTELRKHLLTHNESIEQIKITPENYAELITFLAEGKINSSAGQIVLEEMYKTGGDPSHIIEEKDLAQMENDEELKKIIQDIVSQNQQSVEDYKAGKEKALQFLVGQVMAKTQGKANPQKAREIILKII